MDKLTKEEIKVLLETLNNNDDEISNILLQEAEINNEIQRACLLATKALKNKRTNCVKDFVDKIIPTYSEKRFVKHFRIKRHLHEEFLQKFEHSEEYPGQQSQRICSARKSTAMFLWFAGHPCSLRDVGKRFDSSVSSVSRVIERCTMFLSNLSPTVVKWPDHSQKMQTINFFNNKAGFSKAIGCIGGSRFIFDPASCNKNEYIDKNGSPSLCVQAICNEQKKFMNLFIGFPGSATESWVFQNSGVTSKLTESGDYYLLGNSSYPCIDNLVTPFRETKYLTIEQKKFNEKISSCLGSVEQSFEMVKQRFPQLNYCKLKGIPKICHFIRACCVLHNMANEDDLKFIPEDCEEFEPENVQLELGDIAKGNAIRNKICQEMKKKQS